MMNISNLTDWFDGRGKVLVALSGGVDSALVAYAAHYSLGDSATAVTADYKTLSQEELESAKKICNEIGIRHMVLEYNELENLDFIKNDKNRCFYCRTELATHLLDLLNMEKFNIIVDGTNVDDLSEYRPGIAALKNSGVLSPLVEVGFTKSDVREAAKKVGLSVYDKPSNSCLASRIPWGTTVTSEKLVRIEKSEMIIKQLFGVKQVRVRDFGDSANIEVGKDELGKIKEDVKIAILKKFMSELGFETITIDPEGYKPGKLNVITD